MPLFIYHYVMSTIKNISHSTLLFIINNYLLT